VPGRVEDTELRHGYTLADIHKLTMIAVFRDLWHQGMDVGDRRELAWSAIVERLFSGDEMPSRHALVRAAQTAIDQHVHSELSTHGISTNNFYAGMPNFWRFWWEQTRHTPGPEDRVVDRTALWQIWGELAPRFQRVLLALATHDDHDLAAQSLGIARSTYNGYLSEARQAFYELWHEGEQPSRIWGRDQRGSSRGDHSIASGIIRRRKKYRQQQAGAAS
jgi:hypothetical protein